MLDYLLDVESDFSAIHRVDDIYSLPGPRFFSLANRLAAYPSVMQVRAQQEQGGGASAPPTGAEVKTLDELQRDPILGSLVGRKVVS